MEPLAVGVRPEPFVDFLGLFVANVALSKLGLTHSSLVRKISGLSIILEVLDCVCVMLNRSYRSLLRITI